MFYSFKQAMSWVHTWLGLVMGFVLMVAFFFGALSVFDREIDRWAMPDTRFDAQPMPSFDDLMWPIFQQVEPDEAEYNREMPKLHNPEKGPITPRLELPTDEIWAYTTHRDPVLRMGVGFSIPNAKNPDDHNHIHGEVTINPQTGEIVSNDSLKVGTQWFYPLHYSLNWNWNRIGYWIIGLSAFILLVALVSGVIIHRKLFRDLFTFRPSHKPLRSVLDLHLVTGVVALPFHFFFAFTGLLIFAAWLYFPVSHTVLEKLHDQQHIVEETRTGLPHDRSGVPADMASVDEMVQDAKRIWAERDMAGEVGFLIMHHVGDANSYVSIYRAGSDRVALVGEAIHFKTSSGEVIYQDPPKNFIENTNEFLTGLHLQHFEHWLLRWLYVFGGLIGAICIATGFIFFVEKRKKTHAEQNSQASRIVDALAVTTVTGMLIATMAILIANRLLPTEMADRDFYQKAIFWLAWLGAFVHATIRSAPVAKAKSNPAWMEQSWLIAGLALLAVLSNWWTTGDHLIKTVFTDTYWAVAGVDLSLLATALLAGWSAYALQKRKYSTADKLATNKEVTNV